MSALEPRQSTVQLRRVQLLLLLLILWEVLGLLAELSFGGILSKIDGNAIDGILGARTSFSGASVLPLCLYVYALVRGSSRHRFVLWCAAIQQGAAALFGVYHLALDDVGVSTAVLPVAISIFLLVLILLNMPGASRQTSAAA